MRPVEIRFAAVLVYLLAAGTIFRAAPVAAEPQDFNVDLARAGIPEAAHLGLALWGGMACQLAPKGGLTDAEAVSWAIKDNADNIMLSREQATVVWQSAKANLCDADGNLLDEMK